MASVLTRGGVVSDLIFIVVGLGIDFLYKLGAEVIAKIISKFR